MITNLDTRLSDTSVNDHYDEKFVVLLVDDQTIVAEKVHRDLREDSRIEFHFCPDPKEAIHLAESIHPTIILLDLVMPKVDGIEAVKLFRSNSITEDVPIMMLSCKETGELKANAFDAGANDYLVKMPEKIELTARVVYHSTCYINKKKQDDINRALLETQKKMEKKIYKLMQLSTVDGLTGVGNRRALDTVIEKSWLTSLRSHTDISLIMVDVDHFKKFNDQYGHVAGDDCLKAIADSLTDELPRKTDFVGRYGGEEFAIVLPATNLVGATVVAERLRKKISLLKIENKKSPVSEFISVSMGVSSAVPNRKTGRLSLIESADSALYEAKESGRNQVAVSHIVTELETAH
jgi:two-component system, chemotaxis family, response regulator WspR